MYIDAKEYLMQYQKLKRDISKLEKRINEAESMIGISGVNYSGIPKTHTNKPSRMTENSALRLVELKEKYQSKLEKLVEKGNEIESVINKVEDSQLQELLYYRYIEGLTVEQTAEEMWLTPRWIYKQQKKALSKVAEIINDGIISEKFVQDYIRAKHKFNSLDFYVNNSSSRIVTDFSSFNKNYQ